MREFRLLFAIVLVACGGGDSGDDDVVSITVTPEAGGTLTSADGRFTLEVPAGAVPAPTTISIRRAPADAVPDALAGLVYDLQPEGLQFAVPATASMTLTREE